MGCTGKSFSIPLGTTVEEYTLGVRQLRAWKNRRNKRIAANVCRGSENRSRVERDGIIIESRW